MKKKNDEMELITDEEFDLLTIAVIMLNKSYESIITHQADKEVVGVVLRKKIACSQLLAKLARVRKLSEL